MTAKQARLEVQVQPNAGRNAIVAFSENVLRVKIAAPPVEGKANQELIKYLSNLLNIRKSNISIDRGHTGRRKMVTISGIDSNDLKTMLAGLEFT